MFKKVFIAIYNPLALEKYEQSPLSENEKVTVLLFIVNFAVTREKNYLFL